MSNIYKHALMEFRAAGWTDGGLTCGKLNFP
jgi:hypothetical protein